MIGFPRFHAEIWGPYSPSWNQSALAADPLPARISQIFSGKPILTSSAPAQCSYPLASLIGGKYLC